MERNNELQHWGIKGQKWGIRRYQNEDGTLTEAGKKRYYYQNPDGSLTEEGKAHYMEAARKGKLDPKTLPDSELNMINSRFAKENTYKQNVQKYMESKFSYKLKNAVIERIKGNNNGGGGGKKKGGGISGLLAMPIKKAFEDAFKNSGGNGGGNDGKKEKSEQEEKVDRFIFSGGKGNKTVADFISNENDHISTGKKYMGEDYNRPVYNESTGSWNTKRNNTASDVIRARHGYKTEREKNDYKVTSSKRKKKMKHSALDEFIDHRDTLVPFVYVIRRSDELYHWGIKGQKWGVRRFENEDGTLTPEGKERYGANREYDRKVKNGEFQDDPELKELYMMEKRELTNGDYRSERKRIATNHPDGFSDQEKMIIGKISRGEIVDNESINKISSNHFIKHRELGKKLQDTIDESERKKILKQMDDEQQLMDYAYDKIPTLNRENEYEKYISSKADKSNIDPSYKTFSSKAEKAKAEKEYLEGAWYNNTAYSDIEAQHIFDRVCNLSYNGYDGKPQSDRARSMFDYDQNGYRDYERWVPKYEKSDEWKQIQSERQMLKDKTGYTKAEKDYNDAFNSGAFKNDNKLYNKLSKALTDARRKYDKRVDASDIKQRENAIEKAFDKELTKIVLQDLGYEVNDANMKYITNIIWWD